MEVIDLQRLDDDDHIIANYHVKTNNYHVLNLSTNWYLIMKENNLRHMDNLRYMGELCLWISEYHFFYIVLPIIVLVASDKVSITLNVIILKFYGKSFID